MKQESQVNLVARPHPLQNPHYSIREGVKKTLTIRLTVTVTISFLNKMLHFTPNMTTYEEEKLQIADH